jgi:micrococcal nuclease
MKTRIITSILAIMLLANLQFIFLSSIQTNSHQVNSNCDSSYPDNCISSPPPNLNCKDVSDKDFEVLPPDPHGFDRDEDGIGCES